MEQKKFLKSDMIDALVKNAGVDEKTARACYDGFLDALQGALAEDSVVELRGFGVFKVRTKKGRNNARSPKDGTIVSTDTHGVVSFRPGKALRLIAWPLRKD